MPTAPMTPLVSSLRRSRMLPGKAAASWSPLDLPGLVGWWDFSDTATITESGGAVSQVDDKSGNANHLVQASGSLQPITGTRTINSLNVLDFDGNDYLIRTFGAAVTSDSQSVAAVAQLDSVAFSDRLVVAYDGSGADWNDAGSWSVSAQSGKWDIYNNNADRYYTSGTLTNLSKVIARYVPSGECTMTLNGSAGTHLANGTAGLDVASFTVGSNTDVGVNGRVGEVMYGDQAWDDATFDLIDAYLDAKWGS